VLKRLAGTHTPVQAPFTSGKVGPRDTGFRDSTMRGPDMNLRITLIFAGFLIVSPLMAREKSDVIVMKNGDKITCEVKGLSSNTLYISVDYILNTLSVDWTRVEHIDSKQLFLVKTQDGTVYKGTPRYEELVDKPGPNPELTGILFDLRW
jgi:hypothetical protein